MSFSRANPLGWALFEELTSAQMNIIDLNQSRALDGLNGGVYNLSAPLTINGTVNISNLVATATAGTDLTLDTLTVTIQADINILEVTGGFITSAGTINNLYGSALNLRADNITFYSTATVAFQSGADVTVSSADWEFASGSGVTFAAGSSVAFSGSTSFTTGPTFSSGFSVSAGTASFTTRPTFSDGIRIDTGDAVWYNSPAGWVTMQPFGQSNGLPVPSQFTWIGPGAANSFCWRQNANVPALQHLYHLPTKVWDKQPFDIELIEIRTRTLGLGVGAITGPTEYIFKLLDAFNAELRSETITDSTVHSGDGNHTVSSGAFSPAITVDPAVQTFIMYTNGYNGGTALDGSTAFYQPMTVRYTLRTEKKGVY